MWTGCCWWPLWDLCRQSSQQGIATVRPLVTWSPRLVELPQHRPCLFSSWSTPQKKTARFIWRSDSDIPVISQKVPEWTFGNHFSQKRPDTWYISHFWTANQKLWTEEQEATQWAMGLGILETANCALVHLARWKNHRVFSIFPTSSQNHCKDTSFWGGSVLIRFFLAKSIERFCLGSRSTGRCCLFLQWSTFLRPKWTFLFMKKKVGFHHQMGLPVFLASRGGCTWSAQLPLGGSDAHGQHGTDLREQRIFRTLHAEPVRAPCSLGWVCTGQEKPKGLDFRNAVLGECHLRLFLVGWVLVEDLQFWGWGGLSWECCNHQAEKNSQRPRSQTVNKNKFGC